MARAHLHRMAKEKGAATGTSATASRSAGWSRPRSSSGPNEPGAPFLCRTMDNGYVKTDIAEGIATVTFHHPKSNSLPGTILRAMAQAIEDAGKQTRTCA